MKKSFLSVLTMITMVITPLLITACGDDKDKGENNGGADNILTPDTTKIDHDGFKPTTNIRYIDIDSVGRGYEYAKQELKNLEQKSLELQQYQNSLAAQIQKKANEIQTKVNNNGYLSQQSYEADMRELQTMQQNAENNYGKRAENLSMEMAKFQETVTKAIENYVIKYNKDKKYDAILIKQAGVYFNPELDITDDIIKGLNSESTAAPAASETITETTTSPLGGATATPNPLEKNKFIK